MPADESYPKALRLRRRAEFRRVLDGGEVFPGRQALVRRFPNRLGRPRLGISTPRRYGKAVRRNTFRRLAREAFRRMAGQLGSYDFLVSPRRHLVEPTLDGIQKDLASTRTGRPAPPRRKGDAAPRRAAAPRGTKPADQR